MLTAAGVWIVVAVSTTCWALLLVSGPWGSPTLLLAAVYFVFLAGSEYFATFYVVGGQRWGLSLSEAALCFALFMDAGLWVAAVAPIAYLLAHVLGRRARSPMKLAVNVGVNSLGVAVGATIASRYPHPFGFSRDHHQVLAAALGGLGAWATSLLLVSLAIAVATRASWSAGLLSHWQWDVLHAAANVFMGVYLAWLLTVDSWAALGLLAPAVALLWCYRRLGVSMDREHVLSCMVAAQQRVRGQSVIDTVQGLLHTVAEVFGQQVRADAVLVTPSGSVRYTLLDGEPAKMEEGGDVLQPGWVHRAQRMTAPVALVSADRGGVLLARAGRRQGLLLAVRLRNFAGSVSARRHAVIVMSKLMESVSRWLPDLPETGDPSLLLAEQQVRDAAARLTTLVEATTGGGPPAAEIMTEMHRLSTAVAVHLSGTVASPSPSLTGVGESGSEHGEETLTPPVEPRTVSLGSFD